MALDPAHLEHEPPRPRRVADAGVVLGCVAGMLNVLVMLDTYAFAEGFKSSRLSAARRKGDAQAGRDAAPSSGESTGSKVGVSS